MSRTVSRDKYESMKEKASKWYDKAIEYQSKYEDILEENEKLTYLEKENIDLRDDIELLKERCKEMNKQLKQFEKEKKKKLLVEELSKHFVVKD